MKTNGKGWCFRFDDDYNMKYNYILNGSVQHIQEDNREKWYTLDAHSAEYASKHLLNPVDLDLSSYVFNAVFLYSDDT